MEKNEGESELEEITEEEELEEIAEDIEDDEKIEIDQNLNLSFKNFVLQDSRPALENIVSAGHDNVFISQVRGFKQEGEEENKFQDYAISLYQEKKPGEEYVPLERNFGNVSPIRENVESSFKTQEVDFVNPELQKQKVIQEYVKTPERIKEKKSSSFESQLREVQPLKYEMQ